MSARKSEPPVGPVLVQEEFGYAHWRWHPGLSARDLKAWFRGVDPQDGERNRLLFMDLPGRLEPVDDAAMEAFQADWENGAHWTAHVHMADDSWLQPPDGALVRPLVDVEVRNEGVASDRERVERVWDDVSRESTLAGVRAVLDSALADGVVAPPGEAWCELDLTWREIGPGLGRELAGCPLFGTLSRLVLEGNRLDDADGVALGRRDSRLRQVELGASELGDSGVAALIGVRTLRWLDLGERELGPDALSALSRRGEPLAIVARAPAAVRVKLRGRIAWGGAQL